MILIKQLSSSKLDPGQLQALQLKSTLAKKASLAEKRHWQDLPPDTAIIVEDVASGICVVTRQADDSHQLWHLNSLAAIVSFERTLMSQAPIAIQLIIGHTKSQAANLDQAAEAAKAGQPESVDFYPFYAEVQTVLESCYPKTLDRRLCSQYLISQTAHLSLELQQGQLHLEKIYAYRLKPSPAALASDPAVIAPKPIRHRRQSFSLDQEERLSAASSLNKPMPSTSPPLPSRTANGRGEIGISLTETTHDLG